MGAILDNLAKANEAIENEVAFSRDQIDRQFGQAKTAAGSGVPSHISSGAIHQRPEAVRCCHGQGASTGTQPQEPEIGGRLVGGGEKTDLASLPVKSLKPA